MKSIAEILTATSLFQGLPEEQLADIASIAVNREYQRDEMIFSEGDDGDGFYVVADGLIKVFKVSTEGKEQILHIFSGGEPVGEVPVFSGRKFPASALALKRSRMLFFPRKAFVDLISAHPSLALNMLAVLAMRLRQFTVQIENLSLKEVPGRLAGYLLYLSEEQGGSRTVSLSISKGQLASLLGTIPETLSRILAKMTSQDLIHVKGRDIRLLDLEGLAELSETGKMAEDKTS
ncbi:MAG: Crp/Fnr family transcriptional regulator [Thermodesulfobacteriota bacterium]